MYQEILHGATYLTQFNNKPVLGLANFPKLKKFYLNTNKSNAYVYENGKKKVKSK